MKMESVILWKMDSRIRRGGMSFWKKDSHGGYEEQGAETS